MKREKRRHPRIPCESPLRYSQCSRVQYHDAVMYNISRKGLYFETSGYLPEGSFLYIETGDSVVPGLPKTCGAFVSKVQWCRKTEGDGRYGIGVRYLSEAGIPTDEDTADPEKICDLCGDRPQGKVLQTDILLHLCRECFIHLGKQAEESSGLCVNRFLFGNVI